MDSPEFAQQTFPVGMETVYAEAKNLVVCSGGYKEYSPEMAVVEKPNNNLVDRKSSEYLAQLLNDKKQLQALPNVFVHVEKILDEGRAWFFDRYDYRVTVDRCQIKPIQSYWLWQPESWITLNRLICSRSYRHIG